MNYAKLNHLVEAAQQGDPTAFDEIYELTSRTQYYYISRILRDPCEIQDALQETYLLLYKNMDRIDPPSALNAYLNRLSYFVSKNIAKRRSRLEHRTVGMDQAEMKCDDKATPLEHIEHMEKTGLIRNAIQNLPDAQQSVITMRYYQNLTMQEIAFSMNISRSTAQRLYRSAKDQLKSSLRNQGIITLGVIPGLVPAISQTLSLNDIPFVPDTANAAPSLTPDQYFLNKTSGHAGTGAMAAKSAAVFAGLSISAFAGAHALPAPSIHTVVVPSDYQIEKATAEIYTESTLPLKSVEICSSQGHSIQASPKDKGIYTADITKNGNYTVVITASTGKTDTYPFSVSCIDTECPSSKLLQREGRRIWVEFTDSETGIDFESLYCEGTSGILTKPTVLDKKKGIAVFDLPEEDHVMVYGDLAGNVAEAPLKFH